MKKFISVLFGFLLIVSCSGKENIESKWRVLDEEVYAPKIDESQLYSSLDELEKLMFAPVSYFRQHNGIYSFSQNMTYETVSKADEQERKLLLKETAKYISDNADNFSISYQNNKFEGWDIVWRNNFFYRKQFGGEFTKSFSMGEHISLRDNLFKAIPSIYLFMRENAVIQSEKGWKDGSYKGHLVTISFSDNKTKREPLPEKKYLQNLQGTEEMKDDALLADFMKKNKKNISGTMEVFVALDGTVSRMKIDVSFDFADDGVSFAIKGERVLSQQAAETIEEPEYNEEYHRRTLDSSVNIMKNSKKDKNDDDEK